MSRFSGKQYPGAMKHFREKKKLQAKHRQESFDLEYNEEGGEANMSRKTFGQIRYVRRITHASQ